jgi:hypothetical protein
MNGYARSALRLHLAAALALVPLLAGAATKKPAPAQKLPTEAELRRIVPKILNPPAPSSGPKAKLAVARPDLRVEARVESSWWARPSYFKVTNSGLKPSPQTKLQFTCKKRTAPIVPPGLWEDTNCKYPQSPTQSRTIASLQPGQSAEVAGPPVLFVGGVVNYQIAGTVDPTNAIMEGNEKNNSAILSWE